MNEADFIAALRALPLHQGARDLRDDCAVVEVGGETLIFNHDMMAEGTHFRADADMADVAWKLVASNLSDLAAKGAEPVGILLGHSLGDSDDRFLKGFREALETHNVPLMGGDAIATKGPCTFGLTAIGRATHLPVPSRAGAQVSDAVYVTGILGRAMLGFEGVETHLGAFERPLPRLEEGQKLAPLVTAMMDISDGLLLDAWRLAEASQVSIHLSPESVPVAEGKRRNDCLRWGDDYELLFTIPDNIELPVKATRIGIVKARSDAPIYLDQSPQNSAKDLGYQHR